MIGRLHDAATTEEIAVICRDGLAPIVPADIYDLAVLAGGPPGHPPATVTAHVRNLPAKLVQTRA